MVVTNRVILPRTPASSKASREAAASSTPSDGSHPPFGKTQLSFRFLLVTRSTCPAERAIGIAQHTTRGVDRPLLLMSIDGERER